MINKCIWKFPVVPGARTPLTVPGGSKVISAGLDPEGLACVWVEFPYPQDRAAKMLVDLIGTGRVFSKDASWNFHGTFRQDEFVWHCFSHI